MSTRVPELNPGAVPRTPSKESIQKCLFLNCFSQDLIQGPAHKMQMILTTGQDGQLNTRFVTPKLQFTYIYLCHVGTVCCLTIYVGKQYFTKTIFRVALSEK